jgi:hypothetical protein
LLKDIHFAGRRYFEEGEDYTGYVKKTLDKIMLDRISEEETKSLTVKPTTEKKIIKFTDFVKYMVMLKNFLMKLHIVMLSLLFVSVMI